MKKFLLAPLAVAVLSTSSVSAQDAMTKDEIKQLALEAILENPEIVMQAVEILRERERTAQANQATDALVAYKDLIQSDPNAFVLGNPDGDVTLVEFFDYNCGYCKRATPAVQTMLEEDPNLKVVLREFPILSEGSVFAARAALASRAQDKYEEFHFKLMEIPRADENSVMKAAADLGMDVDKLRADMDDPMVEEHIATSRKLTEALGFTGTPSFIIGNEIVPGFIPADNMREVIAAQRVAQK